MKRGTMNRRGFIGRAVAAGAAAGAASIMPTGNASAGNQAEIFRVGCLNVNAYSHLMPLWAPLINARAGEKEIPMTGMRITHCWEIDRAKGEEFAAMYGCELVNNFDDMLGKVDGIISGGYYNHPWNHLLHEPYLEAGLPNLINRPFANSLKKAKKIIETAKKGGAPVLCPSSHELTDAITRAREWAKEKNIICYSATNSFDDYPTHGVHGVYMVCKAIAEAGYPVEAVAMQARSWYSPPVLMTLEHRGNGGKRFYGTLHQVSGSWGTISIHTPEEYGGKDFDIQNGMQIGFPFNKSEIWAPTVWAYERMARYGEMPQTFEHLYHKTNVFLAGWYSVLENGGKPVRLDEVPEDWESPAALPTQPEDNTVELFTKKFGA